MEYIPYGEVFVEERNNSFSTNYLFNAKELDNETGLYYYGARYLDPTGAMWLSVDPMWEKYAGMSPYNYCMGNPVKHVDIEGNWVANLVGAIIAGGIDYVAQVAANSATDGFSVDAAWTNVSMGSVLVSAIEGAVNPIGGIAKAGAKAAAHKIEREIVKESTKLGLKTVGKEALNEGGKAAVANVIDQGGAAILRGEEFDFGEIGVEAAKGSGLGVVNGLGKGVYKKIFNGSDDVMAGEMKCKGKTVSTGYTSINGIKYDDIYLGDQFINVQVEGTNMYFKKVIENNLKTNDNGGN